MLDVLERWKMRFNSRKSKVMVGKRKVGASWKIGEEIVEDVEELAKHLNRSVGC